MLNLNRVTLIGRLTSDPQAKQTKTEKSMTLFGLATNYSWKAKDGEWKSGVDYHRVVAFGKLAEQITVNIQKGSRVYIEGPMKTRSWTDEAGVKHWMTEVAAVTVVFMDSVKKTETMVEESQEMISEDEVPVDVKEVELW